ncbi:MAG: hypothetical protein WCL32_08480 [Planctomycetota bacterium]|jgi:hypothetical protein
MFINFRVVCHVLASFAIVCGGLGMGVSFLVLASQKLSENIAGAAGFIAGSILIGSGMVTLAILSRDGAGGSAKGRRPTSEAFSPRD